MTTKTSARPVMLSVDGVPRSTEAVLQNKGRDVSIDYLRLAVTVLVILAHCIAPFTVVGRVIHKDWNSPIPIVFGGTWFGFDLLLLFADNCLMALMFFISALFAYSTLERRGIFAFLKDRLRRLGGPFVVGAIALMPLALYASYVMRYPKVKYVEFYRNVGLTHLQATPFWFLWVLLLFDFVMALTYANLRPLSIRTRSFIERLTSSPIRLAGCMLAMGYIAYYLCCLPFGFAYGTWVPFLGLPFLYFQPSRIGVYLLWTALGFLVGIGGLRNGLLARDGSLARGWPYWAALGIVAFSCLCAWESLGSMLHIPLSIWRGGFALCWVASTVSLCFCLLAVFRGIVASRYRWTDRLARTAYVLYLVHYVYLLWIEKSLARSSLPTSAVVIISFVATLALSWMTGEVAIRIPIIRDII